MGVNNQNVGAEQWSFCHARYYVCVLSGVPISNCRYRQR